MDVASHSVRLIGVLTGGDRLWMMFYPIVVEHFSTEEYGQTWKSWFVHRALSPLIAAPPEDTTVRFYPVSLKPHGH